jgi:Fe-S cluster biogenesis protein NfuA
MQQVEDLVARIDGAADPATRAAAQDVMRLLLELHASALAELLAQLAQAGPAGRRVLDACRENELVASVLLLHGLHPVDFETRVRQGLEQVRPYLHSHGGEVELVELRDGVARLRLQGNCQGCPSSAQTMRYTIEESLYAAAPELAGVEVEGLEAPKPEPAGFVPLAQLEK